MVNTNTYAPIVELLLDASCYPEKTEHVELIETHISWVYLTDNYVYKLKKPVQFEFLDFSTIAARRQACLDELTLNQRLAHSVYVGVVPVVEQAPGELKIDGNGTPIDWAVKMRRLPADRTLERLIVDEQLESTQVEKVALRLTKFFLQAPPSAMGPQAYRDCIRQHIRANRRELSDPRHNLPGELVSRVHARQLQYLTLNADVLDERVRANRVVEGHGDLRPEHIYLTADIDVIDCVEFNRELRQLDIADELAFLAMECERLGASRVGQSLFDVYCRASGDRPPEDLIDFYKSYRACVRAKVAALRAAQADISDRKGVVDDVDSHLRLADEHASRLGPTRMIAVRGLMGTGKSTLAEAVAEGLGAELLQTDIIRRERFGKSAKRVGYAEGLYDNASREIVYGELLDRANTLLRQRRSVVLDGTFLTANLRSKAWRLATEAGAFPQFFECRCPPDTARQRITHRLSRGDSTSDARPDLLLDQQRHQEPDPAAITSVPIDTTTSLAEQTAAIYRAVRRRIQ